MKTTSYLCLIFASLLLCSRLGATSLAPYKNLALMGQASDAVVKAQVLVNYEAVEGKTTRYRTSLQVVDHVKGPLQVNQQFHIQNDRLRIGELQRAVAGDLELIEGETYLLFLYELAPDLWQGKMLSYAAFHEQHVAGEDLLVPFGLGKEVHLINADEIEPLAVYKSEPLITMLKQSIQEPAAWNRTAALSEYTPQDLRNLSRASPSHCTYIDDTEPLARWSSLINFPMPVRIGAAGDMGCPSAGTHIADAISAINSNYPEVSLSNSGTHSFIPACTGDNAWDDEYTDWIDTTLFSSHNTLIQFDDPCSDIDDLTNCNGTIAKGGLYWGGTYQANGQTYEIAGYGFVVVNNDAGSCYCGSDYRDMIIHELTHTLNLGHIESGPANMNPTCCSDITSLDQECVTFLYGAAALPVSVVDFWGDAEENSINLEWVSASEQHNDYYTVEKLINGEYQPIGTVRGAGHSVRKIYYNFSDPNPLQGTNHYRLSQTDLDGAVTIIKLVAISYFTHLEVKIMPNPIRTNTLITQISSNQSGSVEAVVTDAMGLHSTIRMQDLDRGVHHLSIPLPKLAPGMYTLEVQQGLQKVTERFVVL